mmetsp:Transcript_15947/g.23662  ORF Transcript_15947/g.23662 Transcript_15947/m.23662 type:complete len:204 (-) Transcript_15947:50-661(-)|eukprot:CAMPEP_0171464290 /NCGR_PEP_ID=MMETSP0945-20130129/7650_1 /TAXON_ID=109269 /ORGANISM="Vaucheria litorea, Strain CCMP2940" /LENGTH=203 /DNA_ID=CAMNT_0011991313 /DNA_START=64 /DNA_END=678 /DNA_ORIENTATION=-
MRAFACIFVLCFSATNSFNTAGTKARSMLQMSGFGSTKVEKSKAIGSGLSVMRKQEKSFEELKKSNSKIGIVHARAKGTENWHKIGKIASEDDDLEAATQGQKRLILDHALLLHTFLMTNKNALEVGFAESEDGEIKSVSKDSYKNQKVGLQLDPVKMGPYYKKTDQYGLSGRIDKKSSIGRTSQAKGGEVRKSSSKSNSESG